MNTMITLTGLTCSACTKLSQKRLARIPGVTAVIALPELGHFEVISSQTITQQDVHLVLEGTAYQLIDIL